MKYLKCACFMFLATISLTAQSAFAQSKIGSIAYLNSVRSITLRGATGATPPDFAITVVDVDNKVRELRGKLYSAYQGQFNKDCIDFLQASDTAKKSAPTVFAKRFMAIAYNGILGPVGMGGVQQWTDVEFTTCSLSD